MFVQHLSVCSFLLLFLPSLSAFLFLIFFFLMTRRPPRSTLFPTRRSSDLGRGPCDWVPPADVWLVVNSRPVASQCVDRKSTRLNSSHRCISYAVFCLKKKTNPRP